MNEDNLQYAFIGNLFANGIERRTMLKLIKDNNFKAEYIAQGELRTAYDILVADQSNDPDILMVELRKKISSETFNICANKASATPGDVERVFREVRDAGVLKEMRDEDDKVYQTKGATPGFIATTLSLKYADFARSIMATSASHGFSIDDLSGDPIPEEENPDCLFAGGFLEKGGGLVLASTSGTGKSSIVMQLVVAWALGREIFGIRPIRPLKIGVFQTENSKNDNKLFVRDIFDGYRRFHDWSDDDLKKARANFTYYNPEGASDDEFLTGVREIQMNEQFDLIVIDPFNAVVTFDISDNTKMNEYLTKKIDPLIKKNADTKCGLIFVHHTNKPPAANMRAGFGTDQYAQYVGAGAAKLPNWTRALLSLMPTDEPGKFKLVAAKRGERLNWPDLLINGKPTAKPTRFIRHCTPEEKLIFWREVDDANTPRTSVEKPSVTKDAAILANALQQGAMTLTEARKFAKSKRMFGQKRGENAYNELMKHLSDYNVGIKPTGKSNSSVVGSHESIEKWFSTEREKQAAEMRRKLAEMEAK